MFLVDFKRSSKTSLFDYARMKDDLSPLFGNRPIQIASPGILKNPYRRRTILPDLKTLYGA